MSKVQQLPEILYHYTSQEGLLGILSTKRMWATNIFYLNDSAEYTYALNLIRDVLEECEPTEALDMVLIEELKERFKIVDNNLNGTDTLVPIDQISILSFTTQKDDLAQWRGYCPQGNGFCLGFETAGLNIQMEKSKMSIVRCMYGVDEQKEAIRVVLDDGMAQLTEALAAAGAPTNKVQIIRKVRDSIYVELQRLIPRMKDEAFRNENEWRFVYWGGWPDGFKAGKSMPVPYKEVPLAGEATGHEWREKINDPLEVLISVVIGPTPHRLLAKASVEMLLINTKGDMNIVKLSKIPYRTW